ncbi:beta-lactamase class D [Lederbergia wuyishanensis]|uniref:Beta-lactamase class D n=2 Tax=Lederbergia wuyishanensis TaxID=1347903 RepID=A0ABU0D6S2_9BACI|nr:class D beta-lactamase [Lederbergia wuyishanensis]MCJ8008786.1 class D beta-lactamase [Lederbergia wuyishanensis]MDQ0344107.1 beta-lactamase class D [Lederbergia wuyishanensis]
MRVLKTFTILVMLSLAAVFSMNTVTNAAQININEDKLEKIFKGVEGTTVIKNVKTGKTYIVNEKRSKERFTPESTFKVPNAVIGLTVKAVKNEYEVKRWDGIIREFEAWNTDHSLASAMRESAIWFYQDMARDIGVKQMQSNIDKMNYGNQDISGGIDTFWLDSSLKISAHEQVSFIEKLVKEELPFDKQVLKTVKRLMINDDQDSYVIHGKTGTRLSDLGLGWYVGYVETSKDVWVFATNVDGSGTVAKNITRDCLHELKIFNNQDK